MKQLKNDTLLDLDLSESFNTLTGRFIVPPFSILDTKQGYWRKRVNEWKSLGIRSDLGRFDGITFNCTIDEYNKKPKLSGCNPDNLGISTATSIFDPLLCELIYTWFIPKNRKGVLDCFAGGSVRGIVANVLDCDYTGVDLRKEQIDANYANYEDVNLKYSFKKPNWICGDSMNIDSLVGDKKFDLLFSCPSYFNLEVYSDNPNDISNNDEYNVFLKSYREIIKKKRR